MALAGARAPPPDFFSFLQPSVTQWIPCPWGEFSGLFSEELEIRWRMACEGTKAGPQLLSLWISADPAYQIQDLANLCSAERAKGEPSLASSLASDARTHSGLWELTVFIWKSKFETWARGLLRTWELHVHLLACRLCLAPSQVPVHPSMDSEASWSRHSPTARFGEKEVDNVAILRGPKWFLGWWVDPETEISLWNNPLWNLNEPEGLTISY